MDSAETHSERKRRLSREAKRGDQRAVDAMNRKDSFDVTCKIGTVEMGPSGTVDPVSAAFLMIASHDGIGTFHFQIPDGMRYEVAVVRYDR